jgi:sugar-specific transcriptional regulator TrmB
LNIDFELLQHAGLTEAEALLYRILLQGGPNKAAILAKTSGIARTNTYNVLALLERRGLVVRSGGGRKTLFSAQHPQRLEHLLDAQQQELEQRRRRLAESMQGLVVDYSLAEGKSGVYRFEGKSGLIRVYDELIRDKESVCSIVNREMLRSAIADYNPEYIRKRLRNKIASRVICPANSPLETEDLRERREIRYLDPERFPFEMDLKVTAKKVVMTTLKAEQISGIIVVDPEVVRNYFVLFEFLWSMGMTAEEVNKGKKVG